MQSSQIEPVPPGSWSEAVDQVLLKRSSLEGFAAEAGQAHGVSLETLSAGAVLWVETRNSFYRMVVLDGPERRVRITGGAVFPAETEVVVAGATAGGSAVKVGWIVEGFRLELTTDAGPVTTSRVKAVTVDDEVADID